MSSRSELNISPAERRAADAESVSNDRAGFRDGNQLLHVPRRDDGDHEHVGRSDVGHHREIALGVGRELLKRVGAMRASSRDP